MKEVTERSTNPQESTDRSLGRPNFSLSHIVAPTDFSSNSKNAVDYAIQLAQRMGARLTLLHIVPEPGALDYSIEGISRQNVFQDRAGRRSFSTFPFNVKQLVVLADLTKESEHAVDYAVSLAQYFKAGLTLLYVSAPLTVRESHFGVLSTEVERDLLHLETAIRLKHTPCNACLRCGRYGEEAFRIAKERSADLLVIFEDNLSWFLYRIQEDFNGNFILDAPCPVAVISD